MRTRKGRTSDPGQIRVFRRSTPVPPDRWHRACLRPSNETSLLMRYHPSKLPKPPPCRFAFFFGGTGSSGASSRTAGFDAGCCFRYLPTTALSMSRLPSVLSPFSPRFVPNQLRRNGSARTLPHDGRPTSCGPFPALLSPWP